MPEKIIRDPVHDVIAFQMDRAPDALLFRLLNSAEFQRLRRIRQLGLTDLAYPGADHSRYSHSLGTMETARRALDRLSRIVRINEDDRTLFLVAALLHDLGHGPFSHVFERISGIDHEQTTLRLIQDPDSEVHALLREYDASMPARLADLFQCRPGRTFLNDLLSSQLDADRFDYLLRDNHHTGAQYGSFDLGWLLQSLTIDPATNRLAVGWKGISAVEAYLQARYHMYRNVYFHKVVRSAEGMIRLALQRAKRLAMQDRLPWPNRDHALQKALFGQTLTNPEFLTLDDVSMLQAFKAWADGEDAVLAGLCRGLLFRRLYKVIDLSHLRDPADLANACAAAAGAVESAGGEVAYELFFDEPSETPYESFRADGTCPAEAIFVQDSAGRLTPFEKISPLVGALNQQLLFRRLHVAERWKDAVAKGIEDGG